MTNWKVETIYWRFDYKLCYFQLYVGSNDRLYWKAKINYVINIVCDRFILSHLNSSSARFSNMNWRGNSINKSEKIWTLDKRDTYNMK